jgi:hypothetical protein
MRGGVATALLLTVLLAPGEAPAAASLLAERESLTSARVIP